MKYNNVVYKFIKSWYQPYYDMKDLRRFIISGVIVFISSIVYLNLVQRPYYSSNLLFLFCLALIELGSFVILVYYLIKLTRNISNYKEEYNSKLLPNK